MQAWVSRRDSATAVMMRLTMSARSTADIRSRRASSMRPRSSLCWRASQRLTLPSSRLLTGSKRTRMTKEATTAFRRKMPSWPPPTQASKRP